MKKVLDALNLVSVFTPALPLTLPAISPTTFFRADGRPSTSAAKTGSARWRRGKRGSPLATLARWPWAASMTRPRASAAASSEPSFLRKTCIAGEREREEMEIVEKEREKKKTLESKREAPALAFFSLAWDMTDAQFR